MGRTYRLNSFLMLIKHCTKKTLIAANAVETHTLEAIAAAVKQGIVSATVTGKHETIIELCRANHIDTKLLQIVPADTPEEATRLAVTLAKQSPNSILMKGLVNSDKFMRAILDKSIGLVPAGNILSHVSIIDNANYHKLLIVSDVAIIPYPTVAQKVVMAQYLKQVAICLGVTHPKIAIIAPSEQILPSIVSCTDAVELMKIATSGQFEPAILYGPMALDVAIDKESAEIKGITTEVAGDADCLLFPNIDAGNIFYKTNAKLCKSQQAAIVMGASVPVVLPSRGDSIGDKLNSIALAALLCE